MKYGRLPRRHDPRVSHMRALLGAGAELEPPPQEIDYTQGMPANLGALLNDKIGDCTAAACCHAQQVWSFNSNPPMALVDNTDALVLYEGSTGYNPKDPSTDQGGDEQTVLTYWLNNIVGTNELLAFVEVDVTNLDAIKRTIYDCGVCYIGINCPAFFQNLEAPGSAWDIDPDADNSIIGGHAVILAGYDEAGATAISWGSKYKMSWAFFAKFVDEAYALADSDWVEQTGQTPGGLSVAALESAMQGLRASS